MGFAIGLAAAVILVALAAWYTLRRMVGSIKAMPPSARSVSAGKETSAVPENPLPPARRELEICSDLRELTRARAFVRSACCDFDEASLGKLELAVTEACANIMKHAYHGRAEERIHLEAEVSPGQVLVRMYHRGDPLDPSKVSPPRLDGSQDSGFGIYLISQCVDKVDYSRDEHGRNCIALVKTVTYKKETKAPWTSLSKK
jgi:anti-sigma regulatory factor (Ser/Thr protein kinase)